MFILLNTVETVETGVLMQIATFLKEVGAEIIAIISLISSFYLARINSKEKRKNIIFENKKDIYLKTLRVMNKLVRKPSLGTKNSYIEELWELIDELYLYGDSSVIEAFRKFANDLKDKKKNYCKEVNKFEESRDGEYDKYCDEIREECLISTKDILPEVKQIRKLIRKELDIK